MNQQRFQYLLDQYILGEISPENRQELAALMDMPEYEPLLSSLLGESFRRQPLRPLATDNEVEKLLRSRLGIQPAKLHNNTRILWRRWSAAAAVLLLAAAAWIWLPRKKETMQATNAPVALPPGSGKAVLTLANGQQIVLDKVANGMVANDHGAAIIKPDSGMLAYQYNHNTPVSGKQAWNTLSTPKGGQYRITLPDGTKVWLNAATSLSFPVAFTAGKREVTVTGEAYFEVKQNAKMPFIVNTGETSIQVLGTAFNIMAYREEGITATTLVNGSVVVSDKMNRDRLLLQPTQQAVLPQGKSRFQLRNPDMEQVIAWKNGYFSFDQTDLKTIMRQLERWYNVTVEYAPNTADIRFTGRMSRTEYASQLLELLELEGRVHFLLKGTHIIVKAGRKK